MTATAAAPETKPAAWYSITSGKWDAETKKMLSGLFVTKIRVIKETAKMLTVETTRLDGSTFTYRMKKTHDNYYGFSGQFPTLDTAKEAYRDYCSERLTSLSESFADVTLQLSQVDLLTETE